MIALQEAPCGKRAYPSEAEAFTDLIRIALGLNRYNGRKVARPSWAYPCDHPLCEVEGFWHLTSEPRSET